MKKSDALRAKDAKETMEKLIVMVADLRDKLKSEIEEEIREEVRKVVESIKIDFKELDEKISLFEDAKEDIDSQDYQNIFYVLWAKKAPSGFIEIIDEFIEKEKSPTAKMYKEYILALGAKVKAVRAGLCVSPVINPVCEKCYFSSICTLKK